jgi:hypothetical protein
VIICVALFVLFDDAIVFFLPRKRREEKKNQQFFKRKGSKSSQITLLKFFDTPLFWNWIRSSQQTPGNTKNHSIKTHTTNKEERDSR